MRHRLRGLSERDWRTLDRVLVAGLVVIETIDLATTSELEGPLGLNIAVMTGIALSFLWRRTRPMVTVAVHARRYGGHGGLADAAAEHVSRRC